MRIILPFPPGGATDLVARILAERASRDLPHKWVVENRSGANGNIGMEAAAKSRPDGYTLGACTIGNCAINASIYARMPYDIERDLVPVFWSASVINLLAVHPSVPARTLARIPGLGRRQQGAGELRLLRLRLLQPPVAGAAERAVRHPPDPRALPRRRAGAPGADGGQVQLMLENVPTLVAAAREGTIRPIAVTGRERDPALPEVPTFAEAGVPDVIVEPWFGYMAPRGTPEPVIRRLNALFAEALADEAVRARLRDLGARPEGGPPERFAAHVGAEIARWRQVVERNGIEKIE